MRLLALIEHINISKIKMIYFHYTHLITIYTQQEYILGGGKDGLTLPEKANSINITLGDDSKLEFREGLFLGINRINSVSIQGIKSDFKNSNNHVVLQRNTFKGIRGSLPEISFKNLKRVTLHEKSLDEAFEVVLFMESIWKVTVEKEVFGTSSYNATFNDIADLNLNEEFLRTTEHRKRARSVFINRCHISQFLSTRATILTELKIENSDVEIIKSKAFAIPEILSLVINNVKIQAIEENIFQAGVSIIANLASQGLNALIHCLLQTTGNSSEYGCDKLQNWQDRIESNSLGGHFVVHF